MTLISMCVPKGAVSYEILPSSREIGALFESSFNSISCGGISGISYLGAAPGAAKTLALAIITMRCPDSSQSH
jgi:hypothetical protein